MSIFCISDSLGLPRTGVKYEDSWLYLIQKEFPERSFYPFFMRDQTSNALEDIFKNYLKYFSPKYAVVQLGICDCAPRIINTKKWYWRIYFKAFKVFDHTEIAWRLVKRFFKRNNPYRVVVPFEKFKQNNLVFVEECVRIGTKIIYISIPIPCSSLKEKSTFLEQNIKKYNSFYKELSIMYPDYVYVLNPLSEGLAEDYVDDGYHSNANGFRKVYVALSMFLRRGIKN